MPEPSGTPEQIIPLPRPVPVYMTYLTVSAGRDGVMFRPDPYGFDALAMPQMFGAGNRIASAI
jgi:murein L,D-transpeptidase YcbB/YkuD